MRVVVLADTHMPRRNRELPRGVLNALQDADLILHLGDVTRESVIDRLAGFAPVRGVHGNNDDEAVQARFPLTDRFNLEGRRLALLHGHAGGRTALQAARSVQDAEIVLFGHSHRPYLQEENGRLLLNPGSPTDPRWSPHRAFALLDLTPEQIDARLVPLI